MHTCTHTHIHIYTYTYLILSSISFTLLHLLVSYWVLGYDEVILHRCGICTYIATSSLWRSYQYINISRYLQWGLLLYTYPLALYIKLNELLIQHNISSHLYHLAYHMLPVHVLTVDVKHSKLTNRQTSVGCFVVIKKQKQSLLDRQTNYAVTI